MADGGRVGPSQRYGGDMILIQGGPYQGGRNAHTGAADNRDRGRTEQYF